MPGRRLHPAIHLPLAAMLLLAACDRGTPLTGPAARAAGAELRRAPTRPLRLELQGNANPDFSQGPCNVVNVESGTGTATHLGRVTWASTEVANFCVDPSDPGLAAVTGQSVLTAANGDQLTITYTSTVHGDFAAGTLTVTGNFVVAGGTGRFEGATGGGTLTAAGSLAPPFGLSATFTGDIAY